MRNRGADSCTFTEIAKFKTEGHHSDKQCKIFRPSEVKCSLHSHYRSLGQNPDVLTSQLTFSDFPLSHSTVGDFNSDEIAHTGTLFLKL